MKINNNPNIPNLIKKLRKNKNRLVFLLNLSVTFVLIFSSCNPSKRVQEGDYLLMSNNIELLTSESSLAPNKKELKEIVKKEDLSNLIKQAPNRKFLGVTRMYLGFYNMVSPEKLARDIKNKQLKLEKKNAKRVAKGKSEKEYKKPLREWATNEIGEIPVIYDSALTVRSVNQIENYLYNKGFFNPNVSYQISVDTVKRRIEVIYNVEPKIPYRINQIDFLIQNPEINKIINEAILAKDSVIYKGDRFDLNDLQHYQKVLTRGIREYGYYLFNSSMVYFQADTNLNSYSVNLSLNINDNRINSEQNANSSYYSKFYIENIYINTSYPSKNYDNGQAIPYDTISYKGKEILYQHHFRYNPKLFQRALVISKDSLYSVDETELSFKKLFELGNFDLVNISYNQTQMSDSASDHLPLDAFINLNSTKNQSISFETTTTNNGGYLGISGAISYSHKNIFKGAEELRISLFGGVEAQQLLNEESSGLFDFNTFEISPEIEILFPHFVAPFSYSRFRRVLNPKTSIAINYNYQNRPDYTRTTTTSYYGYKWNSSSNLNHQLNIFQISFTKIQKEDLFQEYLDNLNNAVLEASYTDNVVPSTKYIGTYNNQRNSFQRNIYYTRLLTQMAGVGTYGLSQLFNAEQDSLGRYLFKEIPFANFIKAEVDFRSFTHFDENNSLAYRVDVGGAWTLKNLDVIPFTDAFFVGGSNSNRAWRPRTLGPGSFFDSTGVEAYDKIGEIKIDLSLEYRFNLVSFIDLALFVDASNIWYMPKEGLDKDSPAVFNKDRFISEIAIGTGFGVRLNFNFFLIRFDFGLQTKDPSAHPGERWLWEPKTKYNARIYGINELDQLDLQHYKAKTIFNLAIGYPF